MKYISSTKKINIAVVGIFLVVAFILGYFSKSQPTQQNKTNMHFYYTFTCKTIKNNITKQKCNDALEHHVCDEDNVTETTLQDIYSEEEILLIYSVIETETYGADIESKTNVACVILNRINHPTNRFGDSVKDVITSPNQFAYFRKNISDTTIQALENAFACDTTQGALFFKSGKKTKTFNQATYIFTDTVGHHFYK